MTGGENRTRILSFRSLSVLNEKGKKKASLLSQARKQMSQDDLSTSSLPENSPHTSRPKKMKKFPPVASFQLAQDQEQPTKKDPIAVFPSVDVRAEQTPPPPPYTPPTLDIQEVEVRRNILYFLLGNL